MTAGSGFVPLRVRSEYSMLESACRITPLLERVADLGFSACGLTDKGNLFGAVEFYQAAEKRGITPLIGCELVVRAGKKEAGPMLLFARNQTGYENLTKLVTKAHLEYEAEPPEVSGHDLTGHAAGLVATSGGPDGLIGQAVLQKKPARAEQWVRRFQELFGPEGFFLEVHNHGLEPEAVCRREFLNLSQATGAPLVATNEVLYLKPEDSEIYEMLTCIRTNRQLDDPDRERLLSNDYFLKSAREMETLFPECPEAVSNTRKLADLCRLNITFGENKYPSYPVEPGTRREDLLRDLCLTGLRARYGERVDSETHLRERLDYELSVIEKMGFVSYFLIVWDFIRHAKEQEIPVGPGRGSGAGSMVAYVLRITDLDPLRYGLIFERFLNPERISPPDIDVDFCQDRRGEVIQYVREKYGKRSVAQIVTYGTLGAKMAVRDVARALGMSFTEASRIADLIPAEPGMTLARALGTVPDLKAIYDGEEQTRECLEYALGIEGMVRQTGTHAAGVVIAEGELTQYLPLTRDDHENVMTQFEMGMLEALGMLKMDFLGLKTLTVIKECLSLVEATTARKLLPEAIPLEDEQTFELLNSGRNVGVFQVESPGMRKLCRQFDIRRIDDIIALIALYRPGPMELIPDYISCKKGETEIAYDHPLLEEVSSDTYGFMIYQEQVMKAAQLLAGYSLGDADLLRRAMGKKKQDVMDAQRARFIQGCRELNNIPQAQAEKIFGLLEKFAGYGFNKSHSAAYGMISYQTAYLKANFPVCFMAALMSNDLDSTDKISLFIGEAREMGIEVLPPSVNHSHTRFSIEDSSIRYGLAAIKGVGHSASEAIVTARQQGGPFLSMADFCSRVEFRPMNKKTVEALVRSGAFSEIHPNRAGLMEQIDKCMAQAGAVARDLASGQGMFFLDENPNEIAKSAEKEIQSIAPWTRQDCLAAEKGLLGVYFSGHPIDDFEEDLRAFRTVNTVELEEEPDRAQVRLAGLIVEKEVRIAKKSQKPFARLKLEDRTGSFELMIWSDLYLEVGDLLEQNLPVLAEGTIDRSLPDQLRVSVHRILPLESAFPAQVREVYVMTRREECTNGLFGTLKSIIREHPGDCPLCLVIPGQTTGAAILEAGDQFQVDARYPVIRTLREKLGKGKIKLRVKEMAEAPPRRRFGVRRPPGNQEAS